MLNRLQKSLDAKAAEGKDKGFTLVELLVVIVIIGILAGIAIPLFLSQREKAAEASLKSDLKNAATVMETYYVDYQTYVGGTGDAAIPAFQKDENNTLTTNGTATAFCLAGTSTGTGELWYYDSDNGGLTQTAC